MSISFPLKFEYGDNYWRYSGGSWESSKIKNGSSFYGDLYISSVLSARGTKLGTIKFNHHGEDYLKVPSFSAGGTISTKTDLNRLLFGTTNPNMIYPEIHPDDKSYVITLDSIDDTLYGHFWNSSTSKYTFQGSSEAEASTGITYVTSENVRNNQPTLKTGLETAETVNIWTFNSMSPSYKIHPYFLIKGKNDEYKDVYISKVHNLDD